MRFFVLSFFVIFVLEASAQSIYFGQSSETTAEIDVQSSDKAVLFPRYTTAQINAISNPAHGLLVFNTILNSFVYNIGTEIAPQWQQMQKLVINSSAEIAAIPYPTAGDVRYNSDTKSIFYYDGISKVWEEICEDPQCQTFIVGNTVDSNANCYGAGNGGATITASGGTSPYTYIWPDGNTNAVRTDLVAGNYTVSVSDSKGCNETTAFSISQPTEIIITVNKTDITINGGGDGTIIVGATGSSGTYDFSINNGTSWQNSGLFTSLGAGDYIVAVRDRATVGCEGMYASNPITIVEPSAITVSVSTTDVNCNGNADGVIAVTASSSPAVTFEYSIDNKTTWVSGNTFTNLIPGSYSVWVRDQALPSNEKEYASNPVIISQPSLLSVSSSSADISCNGGSNGSVSISVSGGNGSNSYLWSNGSTVEDLASLSVGTYSVTVTDSKGCTATASETVSQPTSISIATTVTDVSCSGTLGSVVLDASGGTPYSGNTYLYSDNNSTWTSNVVAYTYSNLSAGSYTFYAKDNNGCTKLVNSTINGSSGLTISFTNVDNEATCGEIDASADVVITGGTAFANGFDFNWDGLGNERQLSGYTKALSAGLHTLQVTDATGCSNTATIIINLPDITFSDDGTGVAQFLNGNEAYWKFKRCADPAIVNLACNCGGTLYYWADSYDYFIDASGNILMPTIGGCNTRNKDVLFGHPDEGSIVDKDGDGIYDYDSNTPSNTDVNFANASHADFQFDPNGTDDVYDKDNLFVSPAVLTSNSQTVASFFDLDATCTGWDNCNIDLGSAVAYCPTVTNEAGDVVNLYEIASEVDGNNLQQSMEGAQTLCIQAYGYGWRVPTIQEIRYPYDFVGVNNPKFDPAYIGNPNNDGISGAVFYTASKPAADGDNVYSIQASTDFSSTPFTVEQASGPQFSSSGGSYVRCVFDTDLPVWHTNADCP